MALPEQPPSPPEGTRPGAPSLHQPSSPASSGSISIYIDDSQFTPGDGSSTQPRSSNPAAVASSGQYLSPNASSGILPHSRPPSPTEDGPEQLNRHHAVYPGTGYPNGGVNQSAYSFTSLVSGRRSPSMLSKEEINDRKSKYRRYKGSTYSIGGVTGPAISLASFASQELCNGRSGSPSYPSHLVVPPGHTLALPPADGQGSSVLSEGTTHVTGTIESAPPEQLRDDVYVASMFPDESVAPMLPDELQRYERGVSKVTESDYVIPCMTAYCPEHESEYFHRESNPVPFNWQMRLHPEGAAFYYNADMRVFTDVDVSDEDIQGDVEYFAEYLRDKLKEMLDNDRRHGLRQKGAIEQHSMLVVEPQLKRVGNEDRVVIRYYFVNPDGRTIFWLHDIDQIFFGIEGVTNMSHKKLGVTAYYWKHWDMYPLHCQVDDALVQEVKDIILHAKCDHLTSRYTAGALSPKEVDEYLSILGMIKPDRLKFNLYISCVIGRIMFTIAHNQYLNFYGQPCARLNSNESVYGWKYHPSLWMKIGSWLLFRAPNSHIAVLHEIYVDGIASRHTWNDFITQFITQLQDFNLLATVLLNANVGFLAIQSVDSGSNPQAVSNGAIPTRSWTQITSYWSLAFSIGSIVLGAFLVRVHQGPEHRDAHAVAKFLQKMYSKERGLERLAVVYSLPYALLMWGIVCFFGAFAIESCQRGQRRDLISTGSVFVITFGLIVYGILSILYGSWDGVIWDRLSSLRPDFSNPKSPFAEKRSFVRPRWPAMSWPKRRRVSDTETGDHVGGRQAEILDRGDVTDGAQHEYPPVPMGDNIPLRNLSSDHPQHLATSHQLNGNGHLLPE